MESQNGFKENNNNVETNVEKEMKLLTQVGIFCDNPFIRGIMEDLKEQGVPTEIITIPAGTTEISQEIADQIDRAIKDQKAGLKKIITDKTIKDIFIQKKLDNYGELRECWDFQNIVKDACPFPYSAEGFRSLYRAIAKDAQKENISAITVILCPLNETSYRGVLTDHGLVLDNGAEVFGIFNSEQMSEIFFAISEEFLRYGIIAHLGVVRYSHESLVENQYFAVDDIGQIEFSKISIPDPDKNNGTKEITQYHVAANLKSADEALFMDRHADSGGVFLNKRVYAKQEGTYVRVYVDQDGRFRSLDRGTVVQNEAAINKHLITSCLKKKLEERSIYQAEWNARHAQYLAKQKADAEKQQ